MPGSVSRSGWRTAARPVLAARRSATATSSPPSGLRWVNYSWWASLCRSRWRLHWSATYTQKIAAGNRKLNLWCNGLVDRDGGFKLPVNIRYGIIIDLIRALMLLIYCKRQSPRWLLIFLCLISSCVDLAVFPTSKAGVVFVNWLLAVLKCWIHPAAWYEFVSQATSLAERGRARWQVVTKEHNYKQRG